MNLELRIKNFQKGFTLIELLVVIAIIGILSSLLLANFIAIRQRARDGQRKADLRQMQAALELYRSDEGSYPDAPLPSCESALVGSGGNPSTYMQTIPCDPSGTAHYNGGNYYYSSAAGNSYTLAACIENTNDDSRGVTQVAPDQTLTCTSGYYFVLLNP